MTTNGFNDQFLKTMMEKIDKLSDRLDSMESNKKPKKSYS